MSASVPSVNIALADDHILFRKGVIELLENFPSYQVSIEANNGKELIHSIDSSKENIDIVILDINMPVMDGYQACAQLKASYPSIKILALTMYNEESAIIKMIKEGADGYLLKDAHPGEFKAALDSLVENGQYYPDPINRVIVKNLRRGGIANGLDQINDREKEFLKLVCSELTYKEIADQLNVSPRTVDGYRENLFNKLEIKSRVGLVLFAIKNDLIQV